ncbi:leucine-rich repeat domain-containing protein, partial [Rhodobium gokarnense]
MALGEAEQGGLEEALRRIALCRDEHAEELDLGGLALESLPDALLEALQQLCWVKRLYLGLSEAARRKPYFALYEEDKKSCNALRALPDAIPIALAQLEAINCSGTQVSDLAPLAGLQNLQTVDCSGTQVSDLAPLAGLQNLQTVDCSRTQVSDLAPLAGLQNLQEIDCSNTQVSDLAPLAGLQNLQTVDCGRTQVSDLAPL